MQQRVINLKDGNQLTVDMKPEFLTKLVEYFSLNDVQDVTDKHIVDYIYRATSSAIDKAELEMFI